MMDQEALLNRWLPARLEALNTMQIALRYYNADKEWTPMEIHIDGKLAIEGTAAGFIFPALECGVINARALLEFMGLCVNKQRRLANIERNRRPDDIGIEQFMLNGSPLPLVRADEAIARYLGPPEDAERGLVAMFDLANKALAHLTTDVESERWSAHELEIACEGIPALLESALYTPLGLPFPKYRHASRPRGG
ncbi:MAG TPA: hypothetical protein VIT90_17085 [Lysobacter sp.]